jgi:hypothetical protein
MASAGSRQPTSTTTAAAPPRARPATAGAACAAGKPADAGDLAGLRERHRLRHRRADSSTTTCDKMDVAHRITNPAVDEQHLPRHEAAPAEGQEQHRPGHVVRPREPAQRRGGHQRLAERGAGGALPSVGCTSPGATQFTRTPCGPSSAARLRLKPTSADLAVP